MRVIQRQRGVTIAPGSPGRVTLDVTNTLEVIDGVVPTVVVPPGMTATANPPLLPLFPDTDGQVVVELSVSPTFPSGSHLVPVELRSSATGDDPEIEHIPVIVPPVPAGELSVLPVVRSVRHRARYTVACENTGNTTLDVVLAASDKDHQCIVHFSTPALSIEPGETATTDMLVVRRRRLLGNELSVDLTVAATTTALDLDTHAVLRHRPMLPRGVRVALLLGAIVAAWAAVLIVGLTHALGADPLTKELPASFYMSRPGANHAKLDALGGIDLNLASADSSAPAGAVPKAGVVIGVGGTISGTVTAASTGVGIGRISVEAYQGAQRVASAATQSDGTYAIVGLLPGPYTVSFSAGGYKTVWDGGAASGRAARPLDVGALATTGNVDAVVQGLPATIRGSVLTGLTTSPRVEVTVTPEEGAATNPVAVAYTDAAGNYTIPALPAPQVYDLSFSANGFQVGSDSEEVTGGQTLVANTVTLTADDGTLSGLVTSAGKPLGGVTITASANGQTFTTATPTSGDIGAFTLAQLPSPETYLVTFTLSGYGSVTVGENLGAGQILTGLHVNMSGGAGTIAGLVTSVAGGHPLSGVTVTAYDGASSASVQTINSTGGQNGTYQLSGLNTPGTYTLTFAKTGYVTKTISLALGSSGSASNIDVKLAASFGSISGTVTSGGQGLAGVSVSITAGTTVATTVTASSPSGFYTFADLAPGTYTLTFSSSGYQTVTYVETVRDGQEATDVSPAMSPGS